MFGIGSKPRVLIAEDERSMREILKDRFAIEDFDVLVAEDGKVAIEVAEQTHPDVLVLDILMPEKSGIEVAQYVRSTAWGAKTPIVFLTNLEAQQINTAFENTVHFHKVDVRLSDVVDYVKSVLAIEKKK